MERRQWLRDFGAVVALLSGVALVGWGSNLAPKRHPISADPSMAPAAIVAEQHRAASSFTAAKTAPGEPVAVEDEDPTEPPSSADSDDQF